MDGLVNLIDLDGSVDHQGQVCDANADNLNGVLHAKGVPDEHQLVQKAEDEEGQEGRDRLVLRCGVITGAILQQMGLEHGKDISKVDNLVSFQIEEKR